MQIVKPALKETVVELQQIELQKVSGCCAQAQGDQDSKASFLQEKMEQREREGSRQAKVILERVLEKHHQEREKIFDPPCPVNPAKCIPGLSPSPPPPLPPAGGGGGGGGGGVGGVLGGATDWASRALGELQAGLPSCDITEPKFELKKDNMEVSLFKADCKLNAAGKEIKLFSLDFSNLVKVPWPEPLATIFKSITAVTSLLKLAENLVSCVTTSATDIVKCLGNTIINNVPPFSQLAKLGDILGDFLGGFAKVAGTVAGHVLKGGSSLIQEAALSKFPAVGASPVVHHSGHSLVIKTHSRSLVAEERNPQLGLCIIILVESQSLASIVPWEIGQVRKEPGEGSDVDPPDEGR